MAGVFGGSEVDDEPEDDVLLVETTPKRSRFVSGEAEESPRWDACLECGEPKNPAEQWCHSCRVAGHRMTGLL